MKKGKVKFFNESKGFGFIIEDETGEDRFVHVTGLTEDIKEGDTVEYELQDGKRGINAVNVKVIYNWMDCIVTESRRWMSGLFLFLKWIFSGITYSRLLWEILLIVLWLQLSDMNLVDRCLKLNIY